MKKKIITIGLIALLVTTLLLFGCTQSKLTTPDVTGTNKDVVDVKDSSTAQEALVETSNSLENIESSFDNITEDLTK